LDKPFIFGVISQALEEALDIPFAVAMVRSRDFVRSNK
jgi:hypothetical protein